jgi:1,2-diacylglycerol 3-alpha-glucosyltransferase
MRIAIFSNTYKPTISGVVTSIDMFRQGLRQAGHQVHLFVPEYQDYQDEEPYIFRYPALDFPEGLDLDLSLMLPFNRSMLPTIRGIKPALIHAQHPFMMGGLAATLAEDLKLPLVFTFHTRYIEHIKAYVPLVSDLAEVVAEEFISRYLNRCSHIIAPTASIRDFIQQSYDLDIPVTVVPTPLDLSQYHHLEPERIRTNLEVTEVDILLFVGRLAPEKNLDFLLRAFARIVNARPQTRLLLVGQGPYKDTLQKMTRKMDLGRQVIFTGSLPHTEIPHFAAAADLFVFPSLTDTQGLVLTEAMAAGTPVVAVEAPGPVDVLAEGGGILVPADEEDFAEAVLTLLDDEARRQAMAETALQVVQRYAIPETTKRLLDVYEAAVVAGPRELHKGTG